MITTTLQRYIVHLDIRATARRPADAVAEAIARVRQGAPGSFEFRVEEVHEAAEIPAGADRGDGAGCGPYSGEFLG